MTQVKYILSDIRHNKRGFIIFVLQIAVAALLISFRIFHIMTLSAGLEAINELQTENAYIVKDSTPSAYINENYDNPAVGDFFKDFEAIDGKTIWSFGYPLPGENSYITKRFISDGFLDMYGLSVESGRTLQTEDFSWSLGNPIPILAGYELKAQYRIGENYTFVAGDNGEDVQAVVVGFLEKGVSYPSFSQVGMVNELDYALIIPASETFMDRFFTYPDFHSAILGSILFPNDPADLSNAAKTAAENGLFVVSPMTIQKSVNDYLDYMLPSIYLQLTTAAIVLLFACLGMGTHMVVLVNQLKRNFSIHLICGARKHHLAFRLVGQVAIAIAIGCLPCLAVRGVSQNICYVLLLMLAITLITVFPSLLTFRSLNLTQWTRRNN